MAANDSSTTAPSRHMRWLTRTVPLDGREAVDLFAVVRDEPHAWLLETMGAPGPSMFGSRPQCVIEGKGRQVVIREGERTSRVIGNPLDVARERLRRTQSPRPERLPFAGGMVMLLNYDMVHHFERLPCATVDDLELPDCVLIETSYVVVVDPQAGVATIALTVCQDASDQEAEAELDRLVALFGSAPRRPRPLVDRQGPITVPYSSTYTVDEYEEMVLRVKEYIAAGDIIQANVSQRLAVPVSVDAFTLYEHLRAVNPSPFAFYIDLGDFQLASCSPERLLEVRGRHVQTRPIAGTRPRGSDAAADEALRSELILNEKERAEHIMLVDLERNDLGRVCEYGTVRVDELMVIEEYSHVFHIVSNVVGRLREGQGAFDAIAGAFPGGTITGCPKVRCMEIIDELEKTRRGPYTGSVGYIGYDGNMDLNIIIRTFVVKDSVAYVQVGGGVVADSQPRAEFDETMHKARALLRAAQVAMEG